jgi:hypothetical protein
MGFLRKKKVIDWTERYRPDRTASSAKNEASSVGAPQETANAFNFLSNFASGSSTGRDVSSYQPGSEGDMGGSEDDRKKRLAKRLMDMTEKIEDLNNQIYHLQQRIELLEKKTHVGGQSYLS